jgi:hypothetical protein
MPVHFTRREIPVSVRTSQAWLRWFNSTFAFAWAANFDSEVPALNRREVLAHRKVCNSEATHPPSLSELRLGKPFLHPW